MSTAAELGYRLGKQAFMEEKKAYASIPLSPIIGGAVASHYSDPGDKDKLYTVLKGALYGTLGGAVGGIGGGALGAAAGAGIGRLAGGSAALPLGLAGMGLGALGGGGYGAYKGGRMAAYKQGPEQESKKEPEKKPAKESAKESKQEKKGAEAEKQPNTSDKPLKPLAAEQPAAANQKSVEAETEASNNHPSASPAKPANKPAGTDEHGSTEQIPDKQKTQKRAALRRAEILSVLYKFGNCSKTMKKKIKKAELRETIRSVGVEKVAALVSALRA